MRVCMRRGCGKAVKRGRAFCGDDCRAQVRAWEAAAQRARVQAVLAKGRKCPACHRSRRTVFVETPRAIVAVHRADVLVRMLKRAGLLSGSLVHAHSAKAFWLRLKQRAKAARRRKKK